MGRRPVSNIKEVNSAIFKIPERYAKAIDKVSNSRKVSKSNVLMSALNMYIAQDRKETE
jgi:metal-responsive CopG/Arc/MetJ family transcriptional regulator